MLITPEKMVLQPMDWLIVNQKLEDSNYMFHE
jgi:hypothetical protein